MSDRSVLKNAVLLYSRMLVTMIVSFYTTRVVLDVLGLEDYGLRDAVAGFASIFTYFNGVMQAGTTRFIALYIGKNDYNKLKECFGNAIIIHSVIAVIILLLSETIGLWFLNNCLKFDVSRCVAANWVYQFAVLGCIISVLQTPYMAVTTAHERFDIYAYLSILDVVFKLLIVYLIVLVNGDKLIIYSLFLLCTNIITFIIYVAINRRRFEECCGRISLEKRMLKKMIKFSAWTALGNLSVVLSNHGINILLNIFIGTIANAARGVANTITWLVKSFASNILTVITPKLTKLYGENNVSEIIRTIFNTSQLCILFISILALPVVLEIEYFMDLWLKETPEYTVPFIIIVLLNAVFAYPTTTLELGINAIGKVKKASLWLAPIYLLYFPMAYLILKFTSDAIAVYYSMFIISILALSSQLLILKKEIGFPCLKYLIKIPLTSILLFGVSYLICYYIQIQFEPSLIRIISLSIMSMSLYAALYFGFVISKENKMLLIKILKQKLHIK